MDIISDEYNLQKILNSQSSKENFKLISNFLNNLPTDTLYNDIFGNLYYQRNIINNDKSEYDFIINDTIYDTYLYYDNKFENNNDNDYNLNGKYNILINNLKNYFIYIEKNYELDIINYNNINIVNKNEYLKYNEFLNFLNNKIDCYTIENKGIMITPSTSTSKTSASTSRTSTFSPYSPFGQVQLAKTTIRKNIPKEVKKQTTEKIEKLDVNLIDSIYNDILNNNIYIFVYYFNLVVNPNINNDLKNYYLNLYLNDCYFYILKKIVISELFTEYINENLHNIQYGQNKSPLNMNFNHIIIYKNNNSYTYINFDCNSFTKKFSTFVKYYIYCLFSDIINIKNFNIKEYFYNIYVYLLNIMSRIMNNDIIPRNHYNLIWRLSDLNTEINLNQFDQEIYKFEISNIIKKNSEGPLNLKNIPKIDLIDIQKIDLNLRSSYSTIEPKKPRNKTVSHCDYLNSLAFKESGILGMSMFGFKQDPTDIYNTKDELYNNKIELQKENIEKALKFFTINKKNVVLTVYPCFNSLDDMRLSSDYPYPFIFNKDEIRSIILTADHQYLKKIKYSEQHNLLNMCQPDQRINLKTYYYNQPTMLSKEYESAYETAFDIAKSSSELSYNPGIPIDIPSDDNIIYREYLGNLMTGIPNVYEVNFIGNGTMLGLMIKLPIKNLTYEKIYNILKFLSISKTIDLLYPTIFTNIETNYSKYYQSTIYYDKYIDYITNYNYKKLLNNFKNTIRII